MYTIYTLKVSMLYILYKVIISIQGHIMGHRRGSPPPPPHLPPNMFYPVNPIQNIFEKKYYFNSAPFFSFWPLYVLPLIWLYWGQDRKFHRKKDFDFFNTRPCSENEMFFVWKNNKVVKQGMRKRARNMKTKVEKRSKGRKGAVYRFFI